MTEPTIYNIYWHGDYVATTNNLDKWLEENNSLREGERPECLDDFVIEEADSYIYKNEGVRRYFYDGKEVN
jgi:hypothetical protein